ncbi:ubiquitin-like domain-containing protein, partial [Prevotella bivia]|nr:ubiquitin-like domain-containing protein [Prevotella bivia]
ITVVDRTEATVVVDGKPRTVLTEGETVEAALNTAEVKADGAVISPAPSEKLTDGMEITVTTPKDVTFVGQNGSWTAEGTTEPTVDAALKKYFSDSVTDADTITPGRDTPL